MTFKGELFMEQVRQAQQLDMGILTMPSYSEPFLDRETANTAPWETFRDAFQPLAVASFGSNSAEFSVAPKSLAWGMQDVNIYAGHPGRTINEISDLTPEEGRDFLGLNFMLARELITSGQAASAQVSIGFNPHDFSAGHHSVARLHSHVRVTSNPMDLQRRERYSWKELDRFDRMAFIEPFADLHHDFTVSQIEGGLFRRQLAAPPERRLGYTALHLKNEQNVDELFADVQMLYNGMKAEYADVAAIFTDGTKDPQLDRYIPRPPEERQARLAEFLQSRGRQYGERSRHALQYLAKFILPAAPRDPQNPRDMSTANTMYITRGFAGAINFDLHAGQEGVRLDILPRVITTTGITKTIMGDQKPTVIAKTKSPATPAERQVTASFHREVQGILRRKLPYWLVECPERTAYAA